MALRPLRISAMSAAGILRRRASSAALMPCSSSSLAKCSPGWIFLSATTLLDGGEEFVVDVFVEPGALDVKELEARDEAGERESVKRELRDGLVGARIRFVVEDVDGAISYLQEVDVPGGPA